MIGCKSGWLDGWAQVDYLPTGSYQISALLSRESRRENREPVSLIYYHSSDFSFFETFSRFAFLKVERPDQFRSSILFKLPDVIVLHISLKNILDKHLIFCIYYSYKMM